MHHRCVGVAGVELSRGTHSKTSEMARKFSPSHSCQIADSRPFFFLRLVCAKEVRTKIPDVLVLDFRRVFLLMEANRAGSSYILILIVPFSYMFHTLLKY